MVNESVNRDRLRYQALSGQLAVALSLGKEITIMDAAAAAAGRRPNDLEGSTSHRSKSYFRSPAPASPRITFTTLDEKCAYFDDGAQLFLKPRLARRAERPSPVLFTES